MRGEDVRGEGGLVDQRTSVYDGDEFDVFRRRKDIDLSQIHIGKRSVNSNIIPEYVPLCVCVVCVCCVCVCVYVCVCCVLCVHVDR